MENSVFWLHSLIKYLGYAYDIINISIKVARFFSFILDNIN